MSAPKSPMAANSPGDIEAALHTMRVRSASTSSSRKMSESVASSTMSVRKVGRRNLVGHVNWRQ